MSRGTLLERLQAACELADKLQALGFSAGERGAALAERQIAESAVAHQPADLAEPCMEIEESRGFLEGELEHLADVSSLPRDVSELRAVAKSAARLAGEVGVGHEGHLKADAARALAGRRSGRRSC